MEQRLKYFEQMDKGFEKVKEERVPLKPEKETVRKEEITETGRREYLAKMKTRLNAWANELNNLEKKVSEKFFDEECFARMEDLDMKLAHAFEKMRDLMERMDDGWEDSRQETDAMLKDIRDTFEQVRDYARGGAEFL